MTVAWTRLGYEFSDEARDLTDAEHRIHVDALGWSNRHGLDLLVPKRDLGKFAESPDAAGAADGLIAKGWWADRDGCWYIGLRFPEWQLERAVIEQRREASALRMRRSRLHKAGDHTLCLADSCPAVTRNKTRNKTRDSAESTQTARPGETSAAAAPLPESADFAAFCDAYPRQIDARAIYAWKFAINGGADPGQVIDAARRVAEEQQRQGTKDRDIPPPSKWLIDERWLDEQRETAAS